MPDEHPVIRTALEMASGYRSRMQAVTFQAPGEVRVEDVPEPELLAPGDAMNTGFFGVRQAGVQEGDVVGVLGLGPVGLCAVQAARHAGAAEVIAIDSVPERLELARSFGATPVHLTEQDPRAEVKARTEG